MLVTLILDVTHSTQCRGSATWIAQELRARIFQTRQLTASAGVAPNKSLAKIASDWHKPNGQMALLPKLLAILAVVASIVVFFI